MTTGSRLFRADSDVATLKLVSRCEVPPPSQQNPEVPPALDPIVLERSRRTATQRYQDMEAFRLDLENWLAETRSPGSAAHLATYMRDLFKARLEREGPKGALSDVDPDATGFSPFGNTRNARARPQLGDRRLEPQPGAPQPDDRRSGADPAPRRSRCR